MEENVWIAKTAKVAKTAFIAGPCIIDVEAEFATVHLFVASNRWKRRRSRKFPQN